MSQDQLIKISQTLNRVASGVVDLQETMKDTAKTSDLEKWKDKILTSNDKVVRKVDQVLTEQKAITVNYKRVDQRLEALEEFAVKASQKVGIEFQQI